MSFISRVAYDQVNIIPDFDERIHRAALLYAEAGIRVIPLRRDSKIAPGGGPFSYESASANKKTIDTWFGPDGKYRGFNLGIACGNGLAALDFDCKSGKDAIRDWLAKYGEQEPQLQQLGPVQTTPSGGKHVLVKHTLHLSNRQNALGIPGLDIKGGDGSMRSHIVAWPSMISGQQYEWEIFNEPGDPPDWLTEELGLPWSKATGSSRGNEEVDDAHLERQYTIEAVKDMLTSIDPDTLEYMEWLYIGQAIHTQHPDDEGLETWDQWSKQGTRYKENECRLRWSGFKINGPIRMGTLIKMAMDRGHRHSKMDGFVSDDLNQIVDHYNDHCGLVVVGGKVKIAVKDPHGVHIMSKDDFVTFKMNDLMEFNGKIRPKAAIWLAHERRRDCSAGIGFFPGKQLFHKGHVNLFQGWGVVPKSGDWSLLDAHIRDVICNGNEEYYTFVLDWMADIFQKPSRIPGTALILHGVEGCGKGTLFNVISHLCGRHAIHVTQESHLVGNFNSHLMDKVFVFADEVTYGGTKKTAGVLKAIVTEGELVCEKKGVDSFRYANCARVGIASNEEWFIPAGPESRRWFVLDVPDTVANNRPYFDALHSQLENGGYEGLMASLLERKITTNLRFAPVTRSLEQQRNIWRISNSPIDEWYDECKNRGDLGTRDDDGEGWPEIVDKILIYESFVRWRDARKVTGHGMGTTHFYNKLKEFGFIEFRPTAATGATRRRKYRVPPMEANDGQEG